MRALISVSDKTGITEFAKTLEKLGYDIISTGGTFKALQNEQIKVTPVESITQFPEMMNGRVKTLHPAIHGGLLALRNNPDHMNACSEHNITPIDLVIVNLYPFEETISKPESTLENAIENIDIGGPSMIRSAAKNHQSVAVIVNPGRYNELAKELEENNGQLSLQTKQSLSVEAFTHTAHYDGIISNYLSQQYKQTSPQQSSLQLELNEYSTLRYGENPHQNATFFTFQEKIGLGMINQLHGKDLSYNNIVDLEAAWLIAREFEEPAAIIIKHTNPCGAAIGTSLVDAYKKALASDTVSAFGSIIGLNKTVTEDVAKELSSLFVEAIIAPKFDENALAILTQKPSLRLIEHPGFNAPLQDIYKHVQGGILRQSMDDIVIDEATLKTVTETPPSAEELDNLKFAFTICKHVKSNAIVIAKNKQTIGVGAGQMSRVEAVEIALKKAGELANGAVLASDAFFPFKDSIELATKAGIKAIIQPGGSKRDDESIEECNNQKIAMTTTGIRHFKH